MSVTLQHLADRYPDFARIGRHLSVEGAQPTAAFFVPGRIEVLGKHTDYAGGRSLVCAVSRGFSVVVCASDGSEVNVENLDTSERTSFQLSAGLTPEKGSWANYPQVVAARLISNFGIKRGGRIVFTSTLPIAAGISSSSALVVSVYLALAGLNDIENRPDFQEAIPDIAALADYLGCLENGRDYNGLRGTIGVGTTGGSQDHTAILCCRAGELSQFAFAPTRFEASVPMPRGYTFAVASSGVAAEKTGSALADYNMLGSLTAAAVEAWNRYTGSSARHLGQILERAPIEELESAVNTYCPERYSTEHVLERIRQFHLETSELIPDAVAALARADLACFGRIVERSQQAAERGLRNQVPETIHLVDSARRLGAAASSAFGAGFGGSVWAMVKDSDGEGFLNDWRALYHAGYPDRAPGSQFFLEQPGCSVVASEAGGRK